jgi:hypothetical protein
MFGQYLGMRAYRRLRVRLSKGDREQLDAILSGGVQAVRTVVRALALSHLDEGRSASQVTTEGQLTPKAVREIGLHSPDLRADRPALYNRS